MNEIEVTNSKEAQAGVEILMNYRRMKDIHRCNNFHRISDEDVAQHSFYTAILAYTFAEEHNSYVNSHFEDGNVYNRTVDSSTVLKKAVFHDVEEAYTSDIPWNIKHANEEVHSALERSTSDKLKEIYNSAGKAYKEQFNLNRTCKDDFTGKFVQAADMIELSIYLFEEYKMGNQFVSGFLDKCIQLWEKDQLYITLMVTSETFRCLTSMIREYRTTAVGNILNVKGGE